MKYLFTILFLSISTAQSAPIKLSSWASTDVISVRAYDINNIEVSDFNMHIRDDIILSLPYSHSGPGQPIVEPGYHGAPGVIHTAGLTASSSSPEDYDSAYFLGYAPFEPFDPLVPSSGPYVAPITQLGMSYFGGFHEIVLFDINTNIDRFEFDYKIQYGVNYINDNPDDFQFQTKIEIDTLGEAIVSGGEKNFVFISYDFKPEDSFSFETLYTRHLSTDQIINSPYYNPLFALFHEDNDIKTQVVLNVSPVPVPAALWLFSSALIGLASVTRRNEIS